MMLSPFITIHWMSLPEVSEDECFYLGDTEDPMSLINWYSAREPELTYLIVRARYAHYETSIHEAIGSFNIKRVKMDMWWPVSTVQDQTRRLQAYGLESAAGNKVYVLMTQELVYWCDDRLQLQQSCLLPTSCGLHVPSALLEFAHGKVRMIFPSMAWHGSKSCWSFEHRESSPNYLAYPWL